MGIFNFVKKGIQELAIARPDEAKAQIVWKWPDKTVPKKAQLTVEPDEVGLFFRDGQFVGQLAAGRHTLESSNIPFLNRLVDWGTDGNLWVAEVFFVSIREFTGLKFGGKVGKLRDPQSGLPIEIMVNGTFSLKVIDPPKLVIGLMGLGKADHEEFFFWFKQQVLKVIRDDVAELCVKQKWPLLDVTSGAYTEEIETEVLKGLRPHVDPYGIEIVRIGNFNLAMKDEDEKKLNKLYENAAYMNVAGGLEGYQKMAAASAMMNAGEGMAKGGGEGGGGMMAGAGLGVGMAMAGQMMNAMQGGPQGQKTRGPGIPGAQPQGGGAAGVVCPKCNATVAAGKFCSECGEKLKAAGGKFCTGCGHEMAPGAKFCAECGTKAA